MKIHYRSLKRNWDEWLQTSDIPLDVNSKLGVNPEDELLDSRQVSMNSRKANILDSQLTGH